MQGSLVVPTGDVLSLKPFNQVTVMTLGRGDRFVTVTTVAEGSRPPVCEFM